VSEPPEDEPDPTPTVPAAAPVTGALPAVGQGLKDTTHDLADVTSAVTDGLAEAIGGARSLLGVVVGGLGTAVDDTVRGLGDGLGSTLGAPR
jgi:hypothetical protein